MTIGEATGLLGLLRSLLLDRPSVDIILTAADHGDPPPGFITPRIGKLVYIEVHATGRTPVRVTWVGLECQDGELVPLAMAYRYRA